MSYKSNHITLDIRGVYICATRSNFLRGTKVGFRSLKYGRTDTVIGFRITFYYLVLVVNWVDVYKARRGLQ